jgi:hypothetical protein
MAHAIGIFRAESGHDRCTSAAAQRRLHQNSRLHASRGSSEACNRTKVVSYTVVSQFRIGLFIYLFI